MEVVDEESVTRRGEVCAEKPLMVENNNTKASTNGVTQACPVTIIINDGRLTPETVIHTPEKEVQNVTEGCDKEICENRKHVKSEVTNSEPTKNNETDLSSPVVDDGSNGSVSSDQPLTKIPKSFQNGNSESGKASVLKQTTNGSKPKTGNKPKVVQWSESNGSKDNSSEKSGNKPKVVLWTESNGKQVLTDIVEETNENGGYTFTRRSSSHDVTIFFFPICQNSFYLC